MKVKLNPSITLMIEVDDALLRERSEEYYEERLAEDEATTVTVEQIMGELMEGWLDELMTESLIVYTQSQFGAKVSGYAFVNGEKIWADQ